MRKIAQPVALKSKTKHIRRAGSDEQVIGDWSRHDAYDSSRDGYEYPQLHCILPYLIASSHRGGNVGFRLRSKGIGPPGKDRDD